MTLEQFISRLEPVQVSNALGGSQNNSTKYKKRAIKKAADLDAILKSMGVSLKFDRKSPPVDLNE